MNYLKIAVFPLAAFLLQGCTTYGYKTAIGESAYAPVDWHKVELLFEKPNRPYKVIGVVSVQGGTWASEGDMDSKLLKSAAVLGADAVLITGEGANQAIIPGSSTTTVNAYPTPYGATATANTYSSPTVVANMPTNKGLAIKYTQ